MKENPDAQSAFRTAARNSGWSKWVVGPFFGLVLAGFALTIPTAPKTAVFDSNGMLETSAVHKGGQAMIIAGFLGIFAGALGSRRQKDRELPKPPETGTLSPK